MSDKTRFHSLPQIMGNVYQHPLDISKLSLFPASQAQTLECCKRTHLQWGRGLSEEDYLRRDEFQNDMEHAANGKLRTW